MLSADTGRCVHVIKIKGFARSFKARLHQLLLAHVLRNFCEFASDIEKPPFYRRHDSWARQIILVLFLHISQLFRNLRGLGSLLTLRLTGIGFPDYVSDCSSNGSTLESASSQSDVKSSQYRRGILRGSMAVSRALCFCNGRPAFLRSVSEF